jgi:hypothetical protein
MIRSILYRSLVAGGLSSGLLGVAMYTGIASSPARVSADDHIVRQERLDDHAVDANKEDITRMRQARDQLKGALDVLQAMKNNPEHKVEAIKATERALELVKADLGPANEEEHEHK